MSLLYIGSQTSGAHLISVLEKADHDYADVSKSFGYHQYSDDRQSICKQHYGDVEPEREYDHPAHCRVTLVMRFLIYKETYYDYFYTDYGKRYVSEYAPEQRTFIREPVVLREGAQSDTRSGHDQKSRAESSFEFFVGLPYGFENKIQYYITN